MGQYWYPCSLSRREFVKPHKLGCGLKLWEQVANHPGTGAALLILCAAMPEQRGGGDLDFDGGEDPFVKDLKEAAGVSYANVAKQVIGRWAGDRIALVGDYAKVGDLPAEDKAHLIYSLCATEEERQDQVQHLRSRGGDAEANELEKAQLYTDITDMVCQVIEHELQGKFTGKGWREFERR